MDPFAQVDDAIARLIPQIPALRRGAGSPAATALFATISRALRARGEGAVFDNFVNNPLSSERIKAVMRQMIREDPAFARELAAAASNVAIPSTQTVQIGNTARGDIAGGNITKKKVNTGGVVLAIVIIAILFVVYSVFEGWPGGSGSTPGTYPGGGGGGPTYVANPGAGNVVVSVPNFDITGSWKSVGQRGWGQAQPGAIVQFANGQANLYSPSDRYAFYRSGNGYRLDVTGLLGGTAEFAVKILDNNNIELYLGGDPEPAVVLRRVG